MAGPNHLDYRPVSTTGDKSKVAVFLDRDGVICRERDDYVKSIEEFEFLQGALEAIRILTDLKLPIVIVTNQSLIGRGIISDAKLREIHDFMLRVISRNGGRIAGVFYCPHKSGDGCRCRKPSPGLLEEAAREFGLRLNESWFVGDKLTDELAGQSAGCKTLRIPTNRSSALLRAAGFIEKSLRKSI